MCDYFSLARTTGLFFRTEVPNTNVFRSMFLPANRLNFFSKKRFILAYFNFSTSDNIFITRNYLDEKEIKNLLKQYKTVVDLSNPFGILYKASNRINHKYLTKEEFTFIYLKTINELKLQIEGLCVKNDINIKSDWYGSKSRH